MNKLYIIGNGFDKNHGLPCSYSEFSEYVRLKHHDDFHRIGNMFGNGNPSDLWKDFENNLASFNVNRSIKLNLKRHVENAQNNPDRNIDSLTSLENACDELLVFDLQPLFQGWFIENLLDYRANSKYILSTDDFYINFNYTNTLETAYKIPRSHICYIHRCLCNDKMPITPIFGHGVDAQGIEERLKFDEESLKCIKETSVDLDDVKETFRTLLLDLKKNTDEGMQNLNNFLPFKNELKNLNEIIILGHSMGESDKPYFDYIAKKVNAQTPITFSYYQDSEKNTIFEILSSIFKHPDRIKSGKMEEIMKPINISCE